MCVVVFEMKGGAVCDGGKELTCYVGAEGLSCG